jgi:hypothetical protein
MSKFSDTSANSLTCVSPGYYTNQLVRRFARIWCGPFFPRTSSAALLPVCQTVAVPQRHPRFTILRPAPLCAALAALLFGAASSASTAQASCGDYVVIGGEHAASMPPAKSENAPRALADQHRSSPPTCQGPSCGRRHGLPTPSQPTLPRAGLEHWACLAASIENSSVRTSSAPFDRSLHLADGHPASIDRPPRSLGG